MDIIVKKFEPSLNAAAVAIWNEVVEEGMAFPQTETLDHPSGLAFFSKQSFTGVAVDQGERPGRRPLYPASQQRGPMRPHLQRELCRKSGLRGQHIGENARAALHGSRQGPRLPCAAIPTRSSAPTRPRSRCTGGSALYSSASSPAASAGRTAGTRISSRTHHVL